jgi:branched-chain amino acid transport system permease protein
VNIGAVFADAARAALDPFAIAYALAAIGLNLHFGFTGLLNFGQAGFMLIGAYGLAITVSTFGGPMWLGILVALLGSVLLSLILGLPTLRLRADYLAIVTIAAAEILRIVFRSGWAAPVTGGAFGLQRFANPFYALNPIPDGRYGVANWAYSERTLWLMVVGWSLVGLMVLLVWALMRSPWGRVLLAIREDEDAARSLGKNVYGYKMQSLVLGGLIGSLGGIVLAVNQQAVNPDTYQAIVTFFAYTALILGGTGRVFGPVIGAIMFQVVLSGFDSFLRRAIAGGVIPADVLATQEVGIVRFILVGLGLMLLMIFRPQGMFGNREELLLDAR